MRYRTFPATGDEISVLGFGAMGFAGWFGAVDDRDSIRALHTALDLGVNMIDTARAYDRSERVVGEGLRSWPGTQPFVATKIKPRGPKDQFAIPLPVEDAFPKGWVTESAETSLRELGRDHVDLMQLHLYWPTWGHEGYWMEELQALKQVGKARAVGISVPDHRHDMVISLVESGLIDSVQTILNIFDSEPLDTLVPICERNGVAVIARCILDEGGLTVFLTPDLEFPEGEFALHHPGVTTGIASMHVEEYARTNIAAVDEPPLPEDVVHRLLTSHRFAISLSNAAHWPIAAADAMA